MLIWLPVSITSLYILYCDTQIIQLRAFSIETHWKLGIPNFDPQLPSHRCGLEGEPPFHCSAITEHRCQRSGCRGRRRLREWALAVVAVAGPEVVTIWAHYSWDGRPIQQESQHTCLCRKPPPLEPTNSWKQHVLTCGLTDGSI